MSHNKYPSRLKIFNKKEKEEVEKILELQFGIKKINGMILQRGEERLFLFQGSLSENQIYELEQTIPIERIGIYFAKISEDKDGKTRIRLSIEGTHIFSENINKNIFELTEKQTEDWMKGNELQIATGKKDFLVMKYKDNLLGTGKASENKISNFIPKNRRLKEKNN